MARTSSPRRSRTRSAPSTSSAASSASSWSASPARWTPLTVQAEVLPEVYAFRDGQPDAFAQVERAFSDELRRAAGVGVALELRPQGEFERAQLKSRRVIDNRLFWRE